MEDLSPSLYMASNNIPGTRIASKNNLRMKMYFTMLKDKAKQNEKCNVCCSVISCLFISKVYVKIKAICTFIHYEIIVKQTFYFLNIAIIFI